MRKLLTSVLVLVATAAAALPAQAYDKAERVKEGIQLHDKGDFDGAMVIYREVLKDYPHDPLAVYELAFSWSQYGKDVEGLAKFIQTELDSGVPQRAELPMMLGWVYDDLGKLDEGEKAIRRALEQDPESAIIHYNLGVNLTLQKRTADAAASFEQALRRNPAHASAWFGLGSSLESLRKPARALFAYARAVALEPDSARGRAAAAKLWGLLFAGVERKSPGDATQAKQQVNITISVPDPGKSAADSPGAGGATPKGGQAEMMEGMMMPMAAAVRFTDKWEKKSDAAFFAHALDDLAAMFSETDDVAKDPFWKLTLPWFEAVRKAGHADALAYTLLRAAGNPDADAWVREHEKKVSAYETWRTGAK